MHLSPHGTKEHCVGDGVIVHCSLDVYFLPCRMLVDNKEIRNVLKNFEMIFFFFFFEICCSHPKIKFKDVKSMDPKMLAIILFHSFRERVFLFFFFYKGFLFLIFIVHQIFIILAKLKQGQDKTARIKEAFSHNTHFEFFKAKKCLV